MTGGFAYVLDEGNKFMDRYNRELVEITRIDTENLEDHRNHLRSIIQEFVDETDSKRGKSILENYGEFAKQFWLVKPKATSLDSLLSSVKTRGE